jgi:hypothetical protein
LPVHMSLRAGNVVLDLTKRLEIVPELVFFLDQKPVQKRAGRRVGLRPEPVAKMLNVFPCIKTIPGLAKGSFRPLLVGSTGQARAPIGPICHSLIRIKLRNISALYKCSWRTREHVEISNINGGSRTYNSRPRPVGSLRRTNAPPC